MARSGLVCAGHIIYTVVDGWLRNVVEKVGFVHHSFVQG